MDQGQAESIYIIDDEPEILMAVETTLKMSGWSRIITIDDSRDLMDSLKKRPACMVILDLNMPHINGEKILEHLTRELPDVPVIILTGAIDVETAVRCMKSGAMDYVVKPVEEGRLLTAVDNAWAWFESRHPDLSDDDEFEEILKSKTFEQILTRHDGMHAIFKYMRAVAPSGQPVLVFGETGVGKELIVRSLHALSECAGELVTVNVAGLDETVFSDTLFGHVKGAFTGADTNRSGLIEKAENGTLFLDEIGDLALASQVKILRLIQEKEYLPLGSDHTRRSNARIVTSTNQDLWALEKDGRFRKDLIYRLSTHTVHVPPLRQRTCDLPLLVNQFVHHAAHELRKPVPKVSENVMKKLASWPFEGNIRELRSMVYDAMSKYTSGELTPDLFVCFAGRPDTDPPPVLEKRLPTLKLASEHLVIKAMEASNNNQSAAAKILGISQQALSKRLQKIKSKQTSSK